MSKLAKASQRLSRAMRIAMRMPATLRRLRAVYGPVRLRAATRVAVFPELGLAYNRIKKNANTSTIILLRQLEAGQVEERNDAKWNAKTWFDLSADELDRLDALHLFVIIRNPYGRVLSAFLDKFRSPRYQRRHGAFPLTPEGFEQFLRWLDQGGLKRDAHWDLQTKLMMLPLSGYDSVIRFESFRDELRALLEARGIALPEGALRELFPSDKTKRTGSSDKLRQFYTADSVALVRKLYAADFEALGYGTEFPAPLERSATDTVSG